MRKSKRKLTTPAHTTENGECLIPGTMPVEATRKFMVLTDKEKEREVRGYMRREARDEKVRHLELVKTESIFGAPTDVWSVTTNKGKWWVITNPTNLYSQDLFPSLDYTLSFHVGLMTRLQQRYMTTEHAAAHDSVNDFHNLIARTRQALFDSKTNHDFQSVGMMCREVLLMLAGHLATPAIVPNGEPAPQAGNFVGWIELIANDVAPGSSNERRRSFLKDTARTTWQFANWLTHARSATRFDATLACDGTELVVDAMLIFNLPQTNSKRKRV